MAVERLLDQAAGFELRAPELALVLGERAAALAEAAGAEELWVRGEGLAVSARVRLGLRAPTVGRAVAALRMAEDAGETVLAARLRTDLAVCARSVGAPLTGLAALRPVLDAPGFTGVHKAAALSQLVGCLSQFGRKPELDRTLAEADRLCGADDDLDADERLLARSLLRVAVSAHRRRHGDVVAAADAARTGLGFLDQLEDRQHDGGVARVRLVLQLVCSLLDRGDGANALELARSVLDEPARAASVAPMGWLRMAIATRVLLPSGSVEAAARMLRDAVHATERHELHALTARLWTELSYVEERLGRYAEAIECLHLARAAEHLHARARRQAVGLLAGEFGGGGHPEVDLDRVLGSVPAKEGAAWAAVAPLSVPEPKVPVSREPSSDAKTAVTDAPRPRAAGEPGTRAESTRGAKPGWSLAPEPADERPAEVVSLAPEPADERTAEVAKTWRFGQSVQVPTTLTAEQPEDIGAPRSGATTGARSGRRHAAGDTAESARAEETVPASRGGSADESGTARNGRTSEVLRSGQREASSGADEAVPAPETRDESVAASEDRDPADRADEVPSRAEGSDEVTSASPVGEAAPREETPFREERSETRASRKTRHDSEHGSVAARSVLDRLGISTGAGGGRRRAPGSGEPGRPEPGGRRRADDDIPPEQDNDLPGASWLSEDAEPVSRAEITPAPRPDEQSHTENEPAPSMPVIDNWLPRLRLPPSLAPWDELSDSDTGTSTTSETPFTNAPVLQDDDLGEPFRSDPSGVPDDDLPEDAGLADLLARALAEHQAGTASAAALVKRLGGNQPSAEPRSVNGHGRNGSEPGNGRHRGDG